MNDMNEESKISQRYHAAQKRRWAKGVLFVLCFILIGGVIGVGATLLYMKDRMRPGGVPRRGDIVNHMLERMAERVTMTPDETARLARLLDGHFDEILAVREQSFRSMQAIFKRMDADVEAVLGADRFKKWFDHKEQRMARWRQRYERR